MYRYRDIFPFMSKCKQQQHLINKHKAIKRKTIYDIFYDSLRHRLVKNIICISYGNNTQFLYYTYIIRTYVK